MQALFTTIHRQLRQGASEPRQRQSWRLPARSAIMSRQAALARRPEPGLHRRRGRGRARPAGRARGRGGGHPRRRNGASAASPIPRRSTRRSASGWRCCIRARSVAWAIGWADAAEIDVLNILQATLLAMRRALQGLAVRPQRVQVDGNRCPSRATARLRLPYRGGRAGRRHGQRDQRGLDPGQGRPRRLDDATSAGVYPDYGFEQHKGYPTARASRRAGDASAPAACTAAASRR